MAEVLLAQWQLQRTRNFVQVYGYSFPLENCDPTECPLCGCGFSPLSGCYGCGFSVAKIDHIKEVPHVVPYSVKVEEDAA